ncbi:hypothetical protein BASA81_008682 [Batrachochytrium salamandrivorans]|nr:hypothetical protein BASA81_008682 [Batrachochytrium salamandrivorans]
MIQALLSRELQGTRNTAGLGKRLRRIRVSLENCPSQVLLGFCPLGENLVGYSFLREKLVVEFWSLDIFRHRFAPGISVEVCDFSSRVHLPLQVLFSAREELCVISSFTLHSTNVVSVIVLLGRALSLSYCHPDFPATPFHLQYSSSLSCHGAVCAFELGHTTMQVVYWTPDVGSLWHIRCNNEWWSTASPTDTQYPQFASGNSDVNTRGLCVLNLDGEAFLFDQLAEQLELTLDEFAVLDFALGFVQFVGEHTFEFAAVARVRLVKLKQNLLIEQRSIPLHRFDQEAQATLVPVQSA